MGSEPVLFAQEAAGVLAWGVADALTDWPSLNGTALGFKIGTQTTVGLIQGLWKNLGVTNDGHVVSVSLPTRYYVNVEVF